MSRERPEDAQPGDVDVTDDRRRAIERELIHSIDELVELEKSSSPR